MLTRLYERRDRPVRPEQDRSGMGLSADAVVDNGVVRFGTERGCDSPGIHSVGYDSQGTAEKIGEHSFPTAEGQAKADCGVVREMDQ